jgi:hypothetical protein
MKGGRAEREDRRHLCTCRRCAFTSTTLQEGEDYEVIPGSDFVISRTAHRSNKSDYYINDRKSNFTEVTELLKGKGVDLDNNRFLILQVCMCSWRGRRHMSVVCREFMGRQCRRTWLGFGRQV